VPFEVLSPNPSPDGKQIVVFATQGNEAFSAILSQDANGEWTKVRRVTPTGSKGSWAKWSPDGRWIAEVSGQQRFGGPMLRIIDVQTGAARVLVERHDMLLQFAVWSPASDVLYFNTFAPDGRFALNSVPVRGGEARVLLRDDPVRRISRFDFATDGKRLFFTLAADESDVFVMDVTR